MFVFRCKSKLLIIFGKQFLTIGIMNSRRVCYCLCLLVTCTSIVIVSETPLFLCSCSKQNKINIMKLLFVQITKSTSF